MSFVSVVAHEKFITVVTDGLAEFTYGDGRKERNENYQKYCMIGPKQFIAFAGNTGPCEYLVGGYPQKDEGYDLDQVALELKEKIQEYDFQLGERALIIVGGISGGEIVAHVFNHETPVGDIVKRPKGQEMPLMLLHGPNVSQSISETFETALLEARTPEQVLQIQEHYNILVSATDTSVNTVTFKKLIYL
ncbi:hypothetical protein [Bacillus toyonensis]|uniref:hypothetical protein n=1 Tax=Bacillus toyonensis TaxID=155322 RepID=UPI0011AA6E48|nr:hypothetical protein [Bacillus toyonensis]